MKALTYHGPHNVKVDTMPDPGLEAPDDIILRVTATAICGSDLHLYHCKIPGTHHGDIFGHEFMGEVVEAGPEVKNVSPGDRVVIPFVIACGDCFFADCSNTPPAKIPTAGRAPPLTARASRLLRPCLATVTFMAVFPADRRSTSVFRKRIPVPSKSPPTYRMKKCCSSPISCQRPGRP